MELFGPDYHFSPFLYGKIYITTTKKNQTNNKILTNKIPILTLSLTFSKTLIPIHFPFLIHNPICSVNKIKIKKKHSTSNTVQEPGELIKEKYYKQYEN